MIISEKQIIQLIEVASAVVLDNQRPIEYRILIQSKNCEKTYE